MEIQTKTFFALDTFHPRYGTWNYSFLALSEKKRSWNEIEFELKKSEQFVFSENLFSSEHFEKICLMNKPFSVMVQMGDEFTQNFEKINRLAFLGWTILLSFKRLERFSSFISENADFVKNKNVSFAFVVDSFFQKSISSLSAEMMERTSFWILPKYDLRDAAYSEKQFANWWNSLPVAFRDLKFYFPVTYGYGIRSPLWSPKSFTKRAPPGVQFSFSKYAIGFVKSFLLYTLKPQLLFSVKEGPAGLIKLLASQIYYLLFHIGSEVFGFLRRLQPVLLNFLKFQVPYIWNTGIRANLKTLQIFLIHQLYYFLKVHFFYPLWYSMICKGFFVFRSALAATIVFIKHRTLPIFLYPFAYCWWKRGLLFNVSFFPFRKMYWFLKFQFKKRILNANKVIHHHTLPSTK